MSIGVVVPIYNNLPLVAQCVDALLASRDIGQVIVVDDASTDPDIAEYASLRDVQYVRLRENVGFLGAANIGMEHVSTQYGVLVNSDTVPDNNNSLRTLIYALDRSKLYVAGPKLLFMRGSKYGVAGTIQHAGIAFSYSGVPYHPYMHLHRSTVAANVERKVNAVTGAVMAVDMNVWLQVGGFDEYFAPGVYEDVDLCLRVGGALYVPQSEWHHLMHGSQTDGHNLFDNEEKNLRKLMKKWNPKCDEEIFYAVQ